MEAEGFSESFVHRLIAEDWYVQRRRSLIVVGIVGLLTKWRWTDSEAQKAVFFSVVAAQTAAVSCFLFQKNMAYHLQSHLPLHRDESRWRELKVGCMTDFLSFDKPDKGGACKAVCTQITVTDEEYRGCGPMISQKPDYYAQSPLWVKVDFSAW